MDERSRQARRNAPVDSKVRNQARIFLIIYALITLVVLYRVVAGHINPLWAVLGFAVGAAIGVALARTKKLAWDETEGVVMGTSDIIGITILVAYLAFVIFIKGNVVENWVQDADTVGIVALSMTAGTMLSRVYFTMRSIRRVLTVAGITGESASS